MADMKTARTAFAVRAVFAPSKGSVQLRDL